MWKQTSEAIITLVPPYPVRNCSGLTHSLRISLAVFRVEQSRWLFKIKELWYSYCKLVEKDVVENKTGLKDGWILDSFAGQKSDSKWTLMLLYISANKFAMA